MMRRFCDRCHREIPPSSGEVGSPPNRYEVRVSELWDRVAKAGISTTVVFEGDLCPSCWKSVKIVLEGKTPE